MLCLSTKGRNVQQSVISHGGRTPWHMKKNRGTLYEAKLHWCQLKIKPLSMISPQKNDEEKVFFLHIFTTLRCLINHSYYMFVISFENYSRIIFEASFKRNLAQFKFRLQECMNESSDFVRLIQFLFQQLKLDCWGMHFLCYFYVFSKEILHRIFCIFPSYLSVLDTVKSKL